MSDFDRMFQPGMEGLFNVCGESGVSRVDGVGNVTALPKAILDRSMAHAPEVIDGNGQSVVLHAVLTVPSGTAMVVGVDRIRRDAELWHVAGKTADSGTAASYGLTRTAHAVVRVVK